MTGLLTAVAGWLLHAAAWAAGAAHGRLDRAARALTGGPDPVDQHAAEAQTVTSLRGRDDQYYAGVQLGQGPGEKSETFRRLQEVSRVRWSPAADAIEGRRRATAERAAPAPTTTHLEPVAGGDLIVVLSTALAPTYPPHARNYNGVIREQAETLAAELERSNLVLVRRLP